MTVHDLREMLEGMPDELEVVVMTSSKAVECVPVREIMTGMNRDEEDEEGKYVAFYDDVALQSFLTEDRRINCVALAGE